MENETFEEFQIRDFQRRKELREFLEKEDEKVILLITNFVSNYSKSIYSYTDGDQKLIVQYLAIDQLLSDENVKSQLQYEIKHPQCGTFCMQLNKINDAYKEHLKKQVVLKDSSYLNFRKRFPLN
jgi:hypothetical protein